jgi:hypothetical protein
MAEVDKAAEVTEYPQVVSGMTLSETAIKLIAEMLAGRITNIKPQYDFSTELGFTYPVVDQTIKVKGKEAVAILESLAAKDILTKTFFDRVIRCRRCQSPHLRPSNHCPKCSSGHIIRGRILEHLA